MRYSTLERLILLAALLFAAGLSAQDLKAPLGMPLPLSVERLANFKKGEIYIKSEVDSILFNGAKGQQLDFAVAGLHAKTCQFALRKLSRYEDFAGYLDFVETSTYHVLTQRLELVLSSPLLPFRMLLAVKLPRITRPGTYPFTFDSGFLKGLTGDIIVEEQKDRCFFFTRAKWQGPHSTIPDAIFELFSSTLARLGMEKLFRISSSF